MRLTNELEDSIFVRTYRSRRSLSPIAPGVLAMWKSCCNDAVRPGQGRSNIHTFRMQLGEGAVQENVNSPVICHAIAWHLDP